MIRILRRIVLLLGAMCCIGVTLYNLDNIDVSTNGTVYLLDKYVDTYYESLSDNVGITTINGISNVYVNMQASGYEIYSESVSSDAIDVSFTKEGYPSYRFYFTYPECRITYLCSDYEDSYTGLAYITERMDEER